MHIEVGFANISFAGQQLLICTAGQEASWSRPETTDPSLFNAFMQLTKFAVLKHIVFWNFLHYLSTKTPFSCTSWEDSSCVCHLVFINHAVYG